MHDIKSIRENPDAFKAALARRKGEFDVDALLRLDVEKRASATELQALQARRNEVAKAIPDAKKKGEDVVALLAEGNAIKEKIAALEAAQNEGGELEAALSAIPNLLADDVPDGADESANVEIRRWGAPPDNLSLEGRGRREASGEGDASSDSPPTNPNTPTSLVTPTLTLPPQGGGKFKEHFELGEALGLMDFERAAKLSGSRFVVLRGALSKLERALAAFMLDIHTNEFGYTEHQVPYLVKDAALFGTGQLPKFEEDLFFAGKNAFTDFAEARAQAHINLKIPFEPYNNSEKIVDETKRLMEANRKWLIPTSEVSLTNLVAGEIVNEASLPMRLTAHTPCFRSEAGSAGRDTRGMIRQHQFSKVELVGITTPEQSEAEHARMVGAAEEVLKRLGLHYRVMLLCAGDTGFSARKTYDLEVWLPGQNAFREISSVSNCGDFQARRMKARYRKHFRAGEGAAGSPLNSIEFVHTLNGSGLAVGRTLVAVLENYQQADGSIKIPDALVPYMGGLEFIQ